MRTVLRLAVLACFLASAGTALAEGFALYEYSARGIALGGAVMARKPDPSAVAYNAALMTRLPGTQAAVGVSAIMPRGKMEWTQNDGYSSSTSGLKDLNWYMPHAYLTYQINDDWFFGVGEFTRFGLGFEYPNDWPGRFNIYEVSLLTASVNPSIAWKVTDKLSIAAGLEVMYITLDLRKRAEVNHPVAGSLGEFDVNIKDADAFGVGANFALHYQFTDQWAVGAQYRSQVRVHAFGDVSYNNKTMHPAVYDRLGWQNGTAHSTVVFPDSVAAGVAFTPVPEFSIEAGFVWTRWSTFNSLNIHFPSEMGKQDTPKHWDDVWRFNVGLEWDVLDWLTLRGGFVYDQSPMTGEYEDYLVPTNDRYIWSGGLGFHWNEWTLDLSAAFIDAIGRRYNASEKTHTLRSRAVASDTYIYSVTLGYKF